MKIPSVSLYIRITDGKGRRYERIRRRNPQICRPKDVYCVHYYENGKRKWLSVGTDLSAANAARGQKEQELAVRSKEKVDEPKSPAATPRTLEELRTAFIANRRTTRQRNGYQRDKDTVRGHEQTTRGFLGIIKLTNPQDITGDTLKQWMEALYEGGLGHTTVCNYYTNIACFLRFCGIDHKELLDECDRPARSDDDPEAYTEAEWETFMSAVINERDALAYDFLIKTGAREREMSHLEWGNLSLGENPFVEFRNKEGFQTKTKKSRRIPLERTLAAKLAEWQNKHPNSRYVFPTAAGKIEGHFLRIMKEYVQTAKLNPADFWLHKCRDSFATWALRRGVDLRTVSHWLGHADIKMTMRYLAPEREERQQSLINAAFGNAVAASPST